MEDKLKLCPICDGKVTICLREENIVGSHIWELTGYHIKCKCGVYLTAKTKEQTIKNWNTRATISIKEHEAILKDTIEKCSR